MCELEDKFSNEQCSGGIDNRVCEECIYRLEHIVENCPFDKVKDYIQSVKEMCRQ